MEIEDSKNFCGHCSNYVKSKFLVECKKHNTRYCNNGCCLQHHSFSLHETNCIVDRVVARNYFSTNTVSLHIKDLDAYCGL